MKAGGGRCPMREHAARHPAEREAWQIAGSAGVWHRPVHPAFKAAPPALDWSGARASADLSGLDWSQVRPMLIAIEGGAREGFGDEGVMIDIEDIDDER